MLNERRVKHMVKLASFETKGGTEKLKIGSYLKKDYVSFHVLCTLLWVTLGYLVLVALVVMAYIERILEGLTIQNIILWGIGALLLYVILLILYGIHAGRFYKEKYYDARRGVKKFEHDLEVLEKMYKREDA